MAFALSEGEAGGIPVVYVSGELDTAISDRFETAVIDAAKRGRGCVIVDLMDVTHVESQPMGRLVKAHIVLEQQGGDLAIVCAGTNVSRIIHTFGFDYMLGVFDDESEAVDFLSPLIDQSN